MGALAVIASQYTGRPLVDPEGFLGPSWSRLPLLVGAALLADLVPRGVYEAIRTPVSFRGSVKARWAEHWTRERFTLVSLGIGCFYITYVCYRNLKSMMPFVMGTTVDGKPSPDLYDRELHLVDKALFFGREPAVVLHDLLGTGIVGEFLAFVYMLFIPMVAVLVAIWLVWSRNITFGYWFVTSQVLIWTLGTATYYALPTLGPGIQYPWLYEPLQGTAAGQLMDSLVNGRQNVLWMNVTDGVQSVAGFASLHTGVTLLWALMVQYTVRSRVLKIVFWCNFGITVVATLYFGWHYVADDVAGVMIALVSFYLGAKASGQKFDRKGSHPTSTTSKLPREERRPRKDPEPVAAGPGTPEAVGEASREGGTATA